jgi:hypothetical protein
MAAFSGAVGLRIESFLVRGLKSTAAERISRNSQDVSHRSREEPMPNDAKLGLLAGVIGVIAAAVLSANRSVTPSPVAHAPPPVVNSPALSSPSTNSLDLVHRTEPASTPIARSRAEPDGTPASRTWMDDIDP